MTTRIHKGRWVGAEREARKEDGWEGGNDRRDEAKLFLKNQKLPDEQIQKLRGG